MERKGSARRMSAVDGVQEKVDASRSFTAPLLTAGGLGPSNAAWAAFRMEEIDVNQDDFFPLVHELRCNNVNLVILCRMRSRKLLKELPH
eukprot:scaffold132540_cov22-Tisochrysis_lutea.AAC.1